MSRFAYQILSEELANRAERKRLASIVLSDDAERAFMIPSKAARRELPPAIQRQADRVASHRAKAARLTDDELKAAWRRIRVEVVGR